MAILEIVATSLFDGVRAYAQQAVGELGGIRAVALLAGIGFTAGFLAFLVKLRLIKG